MVDAFRHDIVLSQSTYGRSASLGDIGLPRIPDHFLDCAIYLYPSVDDAEAGTQIGGSGFLVSSPLRKVPGMSFTIAVTNRHVIEKGCPVVRLNTKDGRLSVGEIEEHEWIFHSGGLDLAAIPVPLHDAIKYRRVSFKSLMTREAMRVADIGPGDDIFVIGRFINRDGRQQNTPTVRFGNISQMPGEPMTDECGRPQDSFLVDARSIAGYSGSPVFVQVLPFTRPHENDRGMETGFFGPCLLGVDWCHTTYREPVLDGSGRENMNGPFVQAHTGLMGVIPAWHLIDLLESPPMREKLDRSEEYWLRTNGVASDVAVSADPPPNADNPTHREDFTSLLNVASKTLPKEG